MRKVAKKAFDNFFLWPLIEEVSFQDTKGTTVSLKVKVTKLMFHFFFSDLLRVEIFLKQ